MDIKVVKTTTPKAKPENVNNIAWGRTFTDHMFLMDYEEGKGWHSARIVPYDNFSMNPAALCLHYGQLIFEGMKAYKGADGQVTLFRPDQNMERLNKSADRMCMPSFDSEFMVKAIAELVKLDQDWIPTLPNTSLYLRPFMMATDPCLAVHPAKTYTLAVIMSPVGAYYKEGLAPVRIYVEKEFVRAVRGGTGQAKCAGNYAGALKSQVISTQEGYSQVLWLDGVSQQYVEEVGSMNVFFVIDGKIVTPALNGCILPGITRKSVIEVLKSWNLPLEERPLPIAEVAEAYKNGKLQEAFGAGTAAVISPIGELRWGDMVMNINNGNIGELSQKVYDEITGMQTGARPDKFNWVYTVK